ncbi:MAG: ABC transporter permease [Lachnospiraceae bacterium]|nr:ABC transporter permease [Lachnospiraceae bacterium]
MKMYTGLTKRNLLVYFKDKQSIIFSLLTSIIVFALYLLFLKSTFTGAIDGALNAFPFIRERIGSSDLDMLTDIILLAGITGSAMITVPYNCLQTVVNDRENNVDRDILATPVKRWQIVLSYFSASGISAILMNGIILTLGLIILGSNGNLHMGVMDLIRVYLVVAMGCLSSTALFMMIVPFFKTSSACGAFFGILSAVSGFVIGAYIPISQFPDKVQTICNIFPASQVTILLRNALLNGVLENIDRGIGGIDEGAFVSSIRDIFNFRASMFGRTFEPGMMCMYVTAVFVFSLAVMMVLYSKRYKKS